MTVVFSIMCSIALAATITYFLCALMNVKWDSDEGIGIVAMASLLSAPFVQFALKFADNYAVPVISGLCMAATSEIFLTLCAVRDDPIPFKTMFELASFGLGFFVA